MGRLDTHAVDLCLLNDLERRSWNCSQHYRLAPSRRSKIVQNPYGHFGTYTYPHLGHCVDAEY